MKVLEREPVLERDPTTTELEEETAREAVPPVVGRGHRAVRMPWVFLGLIVLAVAAVAIAVVTRGGDDGAEVDEVPAALDRTAVAPAPVLRGATPFTVEELTLMELAEAGYIPREAVDWELMQLKALVVQGKIPAPTLRPTMAHVEPLYTAEELTLMELAEAGYIPYESVDWELMELRQLANMGLIPREAVR